MLEFPRASFLSTHGERVTEDHNQILDFQDYTWVSAVGLERKDEEYIYFTRSQVKVKHTHILHLSGAILPYRVRFEDIWNFGNSGRPHFLQNDLTHKTISRVQQVVLDYKESHNGMEVLPVAIQAFSLQAEF